MREATKKMLLAFLAVSIVIPSVFFAPKPKEADAFVGCLIGGLVNKVIGGIQKGGKEVAKVGNKLKRKFSGMGQTVPVSAQGTEEAIDAMTEQLSDDLQEILDKDTEIEEEAETLTTKECTLDGMVTLVAKTMLQTFTKSIVDWINRGFEGSPAFVTNPEGFLTDVADQVIGQQIAATAPFLCAPFRLQLQLALGLEFGYGGQNEINCRLSDVIKNVQGSYQGFVKGDFRKGGWNNWISIAGNRQNNAYGAYIATRDKLQASIITATGKEIKLLDWGQGFRSWRSCKRYETLPNTVDPRKPGTKKCVEEGDIQTPGSLIVGQTNETLKGQLEELRVADEIDEIVGALTNQLITRAMGSLGGLSGVSKPDARGVRYIDTLVTDIRQAKDKRDKPKDPPPVGIECDLETLYVQGVGVGTDANKLGIHYDYSARGGKGAPADAIDYARDRTKPKINRGGILDYPEVIIGDVYKNTDGSIKWSAYFADISEGCRNSPDVYLTLERDRLAGQAGLGAGSVIATTTRPVSAPEPREGNIARGKDARQSSIITSNYGQPMGPEKAVDGNVNGDWYSGIGAMTERESTRMWWRVDMRKNSESPLPQVTVNEIQEIKIYGMNGQSYNPDFTSLYYSPFTVIITKGIPGNTDGDPVGTLQAVASGGLAPSVFNDNLIDPSNPSGRTVVYAKTFSPPGRSYMANITVRRANAALPAVGTNLVTTSSTVSRGNGDNLVATITFTPPIPGEFVAVTAAAVNTDSNKSGNEPLGLGEVQVHGKETVIVQGGNVLPPEPPLAATIQPAPNDSLKTPPCPASILFATDTCQAPAPGKIISNRITVTASRDTKAGETVAIAVQLKQRFQAFTAFSNIFKSFTARLERGSHISQTPSFIRIENAGMVDETRRMEPALAWETIAPAWAPRFASDMSYARIFAINGDPNGLYLQNNTFLSDGKELVNYNYPVFIAAGLSLKEGQPLTITFTGELAPGLSAGYELYVSVLKEDAGTNWKMFPPLGQAAVLQVYTP